MCDIELNGDSFGTRHADNLRHRTPNHRRGAVWARTSWESTSRSRTTRMP